MSPRRNPTDIHILGAVVNTGSVRGAAEFYGLSEMSIRHRLHRLYREKGISSPDGQAKMAVAVWVCRADLERIPNTRSSEIAS